MRFLKGLASIALGLFPALLSAQSGGIPVFLEPVPGATRVATIPGGQIDLIESYPVLDDAKAEEGWRFAEYEGTFAGFVDPSSVLKGLEVAPRTPVYLRPDSTSPVLSLIQEGDVVEIIRVGTDWVEIEFQKLVPVYFQDPAVSGFTPPSQPRPEETAPLESGTPDEPIPVEPLLRAGEDSEAPPVSEEEPRTLDPIRTPPQVDVSPGLSPDRDRTRAPEGAPASDVPRSIEGKLVRATRLFGFKPRYTYELKAPGGRRLAWVDLSGVLVSSLATYEGKQVRIYGEIRSTAEDTAPVVFARTLRLR